MCIPSTRSRCSCSLSRSATTRRTEVPTLLALLVQRWYKSTRTDAAGAGAWVTAARAMVLVGGVPVKRHQNAVLEYLALHSEEFCSLMMQPHEWNARIDLILEGQLAAPHLTTWPPHYHRSMPPSFSSQAYIYVYTSSL